MYLFDFRLVTNVSNAFFTTSIMDRHYKKDMTRQQAYALMIECVKEVQKRLVLNLPNFAVVIVDKDGITKMDTIKPEVIAKAMICAQAGPAHAVQGEGGHVEGDPLGPLHLPRVTSCRYPPV